MRKIVPMTTDTVTNRLTCFEVNGTVDSKVEAQSILPDPSGFTVSRFYYSAIFLSSFHYIFARRLQTRCLINELLSIPYMYIFFSSAAVQHPFEKFTNIAIEFMIRDSQLKTRFRLKMAGKYL
jgi:hypothetical protein